MLIRKPAEDYWFILAELDSAVTDKSPEAIGKYYETLDEATLTVAGEVTRWRVHPPSVKDLTVTLGRHGVSAGAVNHDFGELSRNVEAACDLCRSCIVEVKNYGGYSGPVTPAWFDGQLHEDVQMLLGQHTLQRTMLSRADMGN